MVKGVDYSLYLVTDRAMAHGRELCDIVVEAIRGGVTVVQLREKQLPLDEFIKVASEIKAVVKPYKIPLIINDSVDVAIAVAADGLHIGQNDTRLDTARKSVGPKMIIGVSVSSVEEAIAAQKGGADYLGISPVWNTPTKTDTPEASGLEGVRAIRTAVKIPLVGIGGINASNARAVIEAGCDGIAVASAIMAAENPRDAAKQLRNAIE
jgi:thiamine-phosphate pyrophosphorylase